MKHYKIKKRENKGSIFIANPMVSSFNKPKFPLVLLEVKNPLQKKLEKFTVEKIK